MGALVTTDFLAAFTTGLRAIFMQELGARAPAALWNRIASEMPSTTDKESYSWLGSPPAITEWVANRVLHGLNAFDYSLTNKHYEGTLEIDRDAFEDNKYGMITPRVQGLVRRMLRYIDQRCFDQLDGGATLLAYDGAAFFGTTRTIKDSGTVTNQITGAYSGSSAEILTALALVYEYMQNFKDDKGVVMSLIPDTIVCSPKMYFPIRKALITDVAGETRPEADIFKQANIISHPSIDGDTDDWYVLCTTEEVKPIIFQNRKAPEFDALDDPKSEHVFKQRTFLYGVDARFAVGYGDPRTAIKVIDSP